MKENNIIDKISQAVEYFIDDRGFEKPKNFDQTSDFKTIDGLDSLDLVELYNLIEDEIEVDFTQNVSYNHINSVENISKYIETKLLLQES